MVESSGASDLPKHISGSAPSLALGGGICFRRSCCFSPQIAPLGPEPQGYEDAIVAQAPRRDVAMPGG